MEHMVICIGRQYGSGNTFAEQTLRESGQYFDLHSEAEWGKPESYDLLLSSSRSGVEKCTDLIMSALSIMEGGVSHE